MSKTGYVDPATGAFLEMATDRGLYTDREVPFVSTTWVTTSVAAGWNKKSWPSDSSLIKGHEDWLTGERDFRVPVNGKYRITMSLSLGAINTRQAIAINKNTATYAGSQDPTVAYAVDDNSGAISLSATVEGAAGDVFRFWTYSVAAVSNVTVTYIVEQILEQVPYMVADNSAIISSQAQGDISLRQDGTAFLNKPVDVTDQFKNAVTLGALSTKDFFNNVVRYGNLVMVSSFNGAIRQSTAIASGSTLFTVDQNSPFGALFNTNTLFKCGTSVGTISFGANGTVQGWGVSIPANSDMLFQMIYFCKGE
jgi:hypothetical protein